MFDPEKASLILDKLGPKVLKIAGFGDEERAAAMNALTWVVKKAGEVAKRAETHEAQLATLLEENRLLHAKLDELRAITHQLAGAALATAKKPAGPKKE